MKKLFILIMLASISGCAAGPVRVTHTDGELPKVHVNMPHEDLHLRVRRDEIALNFEHKF